MQYNDLKYVNVGNKVELLTTWKLKKCNFQSISFKWIISVIYVGKFTKFGTHLVEGHLEGTMSQIFYLGLGFYFMMSRKLSCIKW